jgi:hypothetical protein
MNAQLFLELASAALGLMGSLLLATKCRWAGWAFVLWLASNVGWMVFGWANGHWGLVAQHAGFALTSVGGIWIWLLEPWMERSLAAEPGGWGVGR